MLRDVLDLTQDSELIDWTSDVQRDCATETSHTRLTRSDTPNLSDSGKGQVHTLVRQM